ncbi:MAG: GspE/PulE/PilB domain-containing protein [Planctomycetota bacterium]|jgi:hypothetical protein
MLVQQGTLTEDQVQQILDHQAYHPAPFGTIAMELFNVSTEAVEKAWIEQYIKFAQNTDLDQQRIDEQVLRVINRRQAWQFRALPLRRDRDELVIASSRDHLRRAVAFAWRRLDEPLRFLIAQRPQLEDFLNEHYPMPGALDLKDAG